MKLEDVIKQFKTHCTMSIRYGYGEYFCGVRLHFLEAIEWSKE